MLRTTQVKLIRGGKRSQKKENQPRSVRDVIRERGSPELKSVTEKMAAEAEFRRKKVFLMQSF